MEGYPAVMYQTVMGDPEPYSGCKLVVSFSRPKPSRIWCSNGPFVVGYTLCFSLMGALVVQSFVYFTRFPDDRAAMKALVLVILLLESLITAFVLHGFWISSTYEVEGPYALIIGTLSMVSDVWSFRSLAPLSGLVTTLTHGFFCWRIWVLRRSLLIPILVMMLSLLQLASVTYLGFTTGLLPVDLLTVNNYFVPSPFIGTWLGSSLICDLTITIYMTLSLRKSRPQFQNTRLFLTMLTRLTIETGLVTTIAALVELILGIVYFDTLYHVAIFYTISKLYANCLLCVLNFRLVLRNPSDGHKAITVWDASRSHLQPAQPHSGESHVMQILADVQTDGEAGVYPDGSQKRRVGLDVDDATANNQHYLFMSAA
ncbi:hypothetical protein HYDPIDRAFT_31795 [Hydnomerulius pinastri MD-312]|uniref:DUF6534 domain-containing protein n=1 Tax=Hydnomerulius pinastri MD-312 TaxID=994086 RepID=A0A0C9WB58_9AGAM|nr:hypothetical protein HYDPIDRAFT_31794 [Hydnomerulius pinastri MD-312]KIJ60917.1 hypothetical protein HYDPIDRAFT_31795 [Hydnomerulius pinastri MD-312]